MRTYTLTANGLEARVFLTPNPFGVHAHGLTFDEEANTVAETGSVNYQGYCDACIIYNIAADMLATRRRIEHDDIAAAVQALGLECHCDDDE